MKKSILFLILFAVANLNAQYTPIPDPNFEAALSAYDDIPGDGQVPTQAIDTVTTLIIENLNIQDLTGIQDFTALKILRCGYNNIQYIDISNNQQLRRLQFPNNQVSSIDVSQNANLKVLQFTNNQISTIDVSNNPLLEYLGTGDNPISQIDVSQNPALIYLYCYNNQLTDIDVSNNPLLYRLNCAGNSLTQIDVSNNPELWQLNIRNNQISQLDVSMLPDLGWLDVRQNQLTNLNLDNNPALTKFLCRDNQLTDLSIMNGHIDQMEPDWFDARNNPGLYCIFVDDATWASEFLTNIDPQTHFVETQSECDTYGINDYTTMSYSIYPNPVQDKIYLKNITKGTYQIIDITGQIYLSGQITGKFIYAEKLPKGMYILKLQNDKEVRKEVILKE